MSGLPEFFTWQESLWAEHIQALASNRLAHALFLIGSEGTGKKNYALNLAAKVLCSNVTEEGRACGQCHSCQLVDAVLHRDGVHPDLHIIAPEKRGGFIKVDQIRALDSIVRQSAQLSGYRVIIIEKASRLNINAANALLKNLEEPGSQTLFLLLGDSFSGVLPTIRSRCQVLAMPQPSVDESIEWLRGKALSKIQAEEAIQVIGNRPLLISTLIEEELLSDLVKVVPQLAALVTSRIDSVSLAENWLQFPKAWLMLVLQNALHRLAMLSTVSKTLESETVLQQAENILLEHMDTKQLCYLQQGVGHIANLLNTSANPNQSLLFIDWLQQFRTMKQINVEENVLWR